MSGKRWKRVPVKMDVVTRDKAWSLYTYLCEHPSPATETQMRQEYKDWFAVFDAEQELLETLITAAIKE